MVLFKLSSANSTENKARVDGSEQGPFKNTLHSVQVVIDVSVAFENRFYKTARLLFHCYFLMKVARIFNLCGTKKEASSIAVS